MPTNLFLFHSLQGYRSGIDQNSGLKESNRRAIIIWISCLILLIKPMRSLLFADIWLDILSWFYFKSSCITSPHPEDVATFVSYRNAAFLYFLSTTERKTISKVQCFESLWGEEFFREHFLEIAEFILEDWFPSNTENSS